MDPPELFIHPWWGVIYFKAERSACDMKTMQNRHEALTIAENHKYQESYYNSYLLKQFVNSKDCPMSDGRAPQARLRKQVGC